MLETWEAAERFTSANRGKSERIDVARLLGWAVQHSKHGGDQLTHLACACNAAHKLIVDVVRSALGDAHPSNQCMRPRSARYGEGAYWQEWLPC